jgi:NADPH-dependent 7-cyano-7-deazaguanine reductase QueF-like protein
MSNEKNTLAMHCKLFHSLTVSGLAKVAIFTTNVDAENQTLINHKCVCEALNRHFCQTLVCALHEQERTLTESTIKLSKMQIFLRKASVCSKFRFPAGESPVARG